MLDQWLSAKPKDPQPSTFSAWNVTETGDPKLSSDNILAPALMDHLIGDEFLARAAKLLPPSKLRALIDARLPNDPKLRRGVFGEVLAVRILETFHGHIVPIKKLRYRTASHDSPKATDVLAIKLNDAGVVTEVAYVEAKLRTTRDRITQLALHAHNQLQQDCMAEISAIIGFSTAILQDRDDPLFEAIMGYLRSRSNVEIDSHHIFLVIDSGCWRDSDLTILAEHDSLLDPLDVHVVTISALREKVERVYGLIGCKAMPDDD